MQIEVYVTADKNKFTSSTWWASSPDFFIETISKQLQAAQAIWPELKNYRIAKYSADHGARGQKGGEARAAKLSPEQRSEIASNAAKARWSPANETV